MKIGRLIQVITFSGLASFIGSASASPITFNTNDAGTQFTTGGTTLANSLGASATLTFNADPNTTVGQPSNINFGNFVLECPACSTQAIGAGSFFNSFTFDLIVTDFTNAATGEFVGSSSGGAVWSDVSQITVTWVPLQLGPGTLNATSGDFDSAIFIITTPTPIVAPNSGQTPGQSTVQGFLDSNVSDVPEPATLPLAGAALLGLGLLHRRRAFHRQHP
jgi:hypothetical protein